MGAMRRRAALLAPILAALLGCPPDPPQPVNGKVAPPTSETIAQPASTTPADPLAGSVFSKEQLFQIYRAEQAGGAERDRVFADLRLMDAAGQEIPTRVKAYQAALQQYAKNDPEGWSAFVESLPE